jgi:hypothetical protein
MMTSHGKFKNLFYLQSKHFGLKWLFGPDAMII